MMFWDASALIPLCVQEAQSPVVRELLEHDGVPVVWWGTALECRSAFARLRREGVFDEPMETAAWKPLSLLRESWMEILPSNELREKALRLVAVHDLRAADALQLAAALAWAGDRPTGCAFVCLDRRLRSAAGREGFEVLPLE
jgi:predicted nucleic acid-binding protein